MSESLIHVGDKRDYNNDHWLSDWNGDEVGFDEIQIVGMYSVKEKPDIQYYVDTETGIVLKWCVEEDY